MLVLYTPLAHAQEEDMTDLLYVQAEKSSELAEELVSQKTITLSSSSSFVSTLSNFFSPS